MTSDNRKHGAQNKSTLRFLKGPSRGNTNKPAPAIFGRQAQTFNPIRNSKPEQLVRCSGCGLRCFPSEQKFGFRDSNCDICLQEKRQTYAIGQSPKLVYYARSITNNTHGGQTR